MNYLKYQKFQFFEKNVRSRKLQDDPRGINLMPFLNELRYNSGIGRKLKLNPCGFYRKKIQCNQATGKYVFCAIFIHQGKKKHVFYKKMSEIAMINHYNGLYWIMFTEY